MGDSVASGTYASRPYTTPSTATMKIEVISEMETNNGKRIYFWNQSSFEWNSLT
jgi:hypothetical protein